MKILSRQMPNRSTFALLILLLLPSLTFANSGSKGERPAIPDAEYQDINGVTHNLQEWRGKVFMLNFWATWCAPCQYEIKEFIQYQKQYQGQGLQIVGLGLDDTRKLQNVHRSLEMNYPVLVSGDEETRKILRQWGNRRGVIPFTVIFDKSGHLVKGFIGPMDEESFKAVVLPLLAEK